MKRVYTYVDAHPFPRKLSKDLLGSKANTKPKTQRKPRPTRKGRPTSKPYKYLTG